MDQQVGAIVTMPREKVVFDEDLTCAPGLHFCSKDYLRFFFNEEKGNRVVLIKINPADVVSIPADYNNTKGRCCRFEVLAEVGQSDLWGMPAVKKEIGCKPKATSTKKLGASKGKKQKVGKTLSEVKKSKANKNDEKTNKKCRHKGEGITNVKDTAEKSSIRNKKTK